MKEKAEPQQTKAQTQPAARQSSGLGMDSAESEQLSQLEATIENSPQQQKQRAMAAMINSGPSATAQRRLSEAINNSPRNLAQRQQLNNLFDTAQREDVEEPPLQANLTSDAPAQPKPPPDSRPNHTGLPDTLKSGIEHISGMSMNDVRVHYNSAKPAQLQAHAYAQGNEIHLAAGQEKHLPHEAWHVVQQRQGRVRPALRMKDWVDVNDDEGLEREADLMGGRALQSNVETGNQNTMRPGTFAKSLESNPTDTQFGPLHNRPAIQLKTEIAHTPGYIILERPDQTELKLMVGKTMEAKLDVKQPIRGTATGKIWKEMGDLIRMFKNFNIVKGHLLNHDLGGFAKEENIYPISTTANQEHSERVEQNVKELLNKQGSEEESHKDEKGAAKRVGYTVEVEENTIHNPSDASFICKWGLEGGQQRQMIVKSNLGGQKKGFVNKNRKEVRPHSNWDHENRSEATSGVDEEWSRYINSQDVKNRSIEVRSINEDNASGVPWTRGKYYTKMKEWATEQAHSLANSNVLIEKIKMALVNRTFGPNERGMALAYHLKKHVCDTIEKALVFEITYGRARGETLEEKDVCGVVTRMEQSLKKQYDDLEDDLQFQYQEEEKEERRLRCDPPPNKKRCVTQQKYWIERNSVSNDLVEGAKRNIETLVNDNIDSLFRENSTGEDHKSNRIRDDAVPGETDHSSDDHDGGEQAMQSGG